MSRREKLPLKAFWETVEQRLAARSADELRAILGATAQETLPSERQAFLDQLQPDQAEHPGLAWTTAQVTPATAMSTGWARRPHTGGARCEPA